MSAGGTDSPTLSKALRAAARPLDWAAEHHEAERVVEKANERIADFLDMPSQGLEESPLRTVIDKTRFLAL